MNSLISEFPGLYDKNPCQGWVFYDGECILCLDLANRYGPRLTKAGFFLVPLQTAGVKERLGLTTDNLLLEMKVMNKEGKVFGGAEAVVYLSKYIWWAIPLTLLAKLPFGMRILRWGYRKVAAKRQCTNGTCRTREA